MFIFSLILLLVTLASCAPHTLRLRQTTCYSGVYVIGARGSDEDPGYGSVAPVVDGVLSSIPNSGAVALDYPASVLDPVYPDSVTDGINTMISLIETYVNNCEGKIVLVGFSQGGNVVTDVLAGGVDKPDPLSPSYAARSKYFWVLGKRNHLTRTQYLQ
jgi:acetylxylan esterase